MYASRPRPVVLEHEPNAIHTPIIGPPSVGLWLAFAALHVPLAIWMKSESIVTYAHGFITFATGMWWAVSSNKLERTALVGAYIIGSEVLWRMTTDALPWESGKVMIILIFGAALLNAKGLKSLAWPALFFALLIPSSVLTIKDADFTVWRGQLSFNLLGPLALVVSARLFSYVNLSPNRLLRLFLLIISPILGLAALVILGIVTVKAIVFTTESNFATSGGFGPNQVSLALGLGALSALWGVLEPATVWPLRLTLFSIMVWLATQSVLTFSRGGFLGALIASLVAVMFLMTVRQTRRRLILLIPLVLILGSQVIWPSLVEFTGGTLAERYQETNLTGRGDLANEDLEVWKENPVLGVGPGHSRFEHRKNAITHTEFSRLVSEHGSFGAFAILMLLVTGVRNVYMAPSAREKGLAGSVTVWSLMFMLNAAMRTASPAFMFGLGFCDFGSRPPAPASVPAASRSGLRWRGFGTMSHLRPRADF